MSIISYIKQAIETIAGFNECVAFFQWLRSLQTCSNGAENQVLKEDDVLKLKSSLQCLRDTLPTVRNFIDLAEWRSHDICVAEHLPELKAAMYDAEDLLEYFQYYELKVKIEGSATSSEPGPKFFHDAIQGNLEKLNHIKERLDNQCTQLERIGLRQATPRFDRSVRLETTSFPTEEKIFGRDNEIKKLIRLLGVSTNDGSSRPKRKRNVPVLPIVGIGGVGKTTLAQTICSHPQVKRHFDVIVWVCVSDDFDVKRLTKEAIEQFYGEASTKDNLNSLQADLANGLNKRRSLIVLDDMWDENRELWKMFCAPFKHVVEGSMMLVTTRSGKVSDIVRTMDPFLLDGLRDNVFQNFFKLCVFGSDSSTINPELKQIGKRIIPKLKGSPLAAKTIGRLLGMSLDPAHWNMILNSQLWELEQESTDILPALRLSYMYLPFHLKRCFSFCALYPKDYNFVMEDLAEIWMAEGFVESQYNIPLQQTALKYFEELAHLSFFQELHGNYVMHDLIHDMAQLVSKDDCFIIKEKKDLERIPQKVRHLSVLQSRDVEWSDLENLCKQTKLRTILCNKYLGWDKDNNNVMEKWCAEFVCMRVMVCASISESGLPDSISNMKNLRYLRIKYCHSFDISLPAAFCHLYNLQIFSARRCKIKVIPRGFDNLINLQKFESEFLNISIKSLKLQHYPGEHLPSWFHTSGVLSPLIEIKVLDCSRLSSLEQFLQPTYIPAIKKLVIRDCTSLESVPVERFGGFPVLEELEVLNCPKINSRCLQAPSLKKLLLDYSGSLGDDIDCYSLTTFHLSNYQLASLTFNREKIPLLTNLTIHGCSDLETLNGDLPALEELEVHNCPKINSRCLQAPSLNKLLLNNSGSLGDDIDCCSLTTFHLSNYYLETLTFNREKIPLLTNLTIHRCSELETLNGDLPALEELEVRNCPKIKSRCLQAPSLKKLVLDYSGSLGDDIDCCSLTTFHLSDYYLASLTFNREKIPLLTDLNIYGCSELETLNGGWSILKSLTIRHCPRLKWENGIVLPSSLQKLSFVDCGYFTVSCLENLVSLESLSMIECKQIEKIPRDLWSSNLNSLQELTIWRCEDLVSIGGPEAIAHIPTVYIGDCPKLRGVQQPLIRGWLPYKP